MFPSILAPPPKPERFQSGVSSFALGDSGLTLILEDGGFEGAVEEIEPGLFEAKLQRVHAGESAPGGGCELRLEIPLIDLRGIWYPGADRETMGGLPLWDITFRSQGTVSAPVITLFDSSGANRLTFVAFDALHESELSISLSEERVSLTLTFCRFSETASQETFRIDLRPLEICDILAEVANWWAENEEMQPCAVPSCALDPVLSTWYSMHQHVSPGPIESECTLARPLGCKTLIVDDGWQTADKSRGYGFCGDWLIDHKKMPDMVGHIRRVQNLGLRYVLWIAPLWIGDRSEAADRFRAKMLYHSASMAASVADPRFPDVREFLVSTFIRLANDLNLDGYKIDFVDLVSDTPAAKAAETGNGRDIDSVAGAMDILLREMTDAFRSVKPDFLVEFRQSYVGPMMRRYGNMFRAGDCPNDPDRNRFRTIMIRLLAGDTPAHADMFSWHAEETGETVARHMLSSLFAVPQISVMLAALPDEHLHIVRHWLNFWLQNRDLLLGGKFRPLYPHLGFPIVEVSKPGCRLLALYEQLVVKVAPAEEMLFVNACGANRIAVNFTTSLGNTRICAWDKDGGFVSESSKDLAAGLAEIEIPPFGYARLLLATP